MTNGTIKICQKCGEEKSARGFSMHYAHCKGDLLEENKTVSVTNAPPLASKEAKPNAYQHLTVGYDLLNRAQQEREADKIIKQAQSQGSKPTSPIECPKCHCQNVERKLGYMEPMQTYRCKICGEAYKRNNLTGEYLW